MKITIFTLMLSLMTCIVSTGCFAQAKDMSKMKDCCMMKDGKMMHMKGGKTMAMNKDMTMKNGTKCMTNGDCVMKDGTKMKMKDGDCMDMDGKMDKCDMMNMHGKTTHDTKDHEKHTAMKYTCSMHPEVVSDKPGKCPKCSMDLIEKK